MTVSELNSRYRLERIQTNQKLIHGQYNLLFNHFFIPLMFWYFHIIIFCTNPLSHCVHCIVFEMSVFMPTVNSFATYANWSRHLIHCSKLTMNELVCIRSICFHINLVFFFCSGALLKNTIEIKLISFVTCWLCGNLNIFCNLNSVASAIKQFHGIVDMMREIRSQFILWHALITLYVRAGSIIIPPMCTFHKTEWIFKSEMPQMRIKVVDQSFFYGFFFQMYKY